MTDWLILTGILVATIIAIIIDAGRSVGRGPRE